MFSDEGHVIEIEKGFWRAAGDVSFYREHLDQNAVFILPDPIGRLEGDRIVDSIIRATPWREFELEGVHCLSLSDVTVAVTYQATALRSGQKYSAWVSSVYVRKGDAWRLTLHHQTSRR